MVAMVGICEFGASASRPIFTRESILCTRRCPSVLLVVIVEGLLITLDYGDPMATFWQVVPLQLAAIYHLTLTRTWGDGTRVQHQVIACAWSALAFSAGAVLLQVPMGYILLSHVTGTLACPATSCCFQERVNIAILVALVTFVVGVVLKATGSMLLGFQAVE